MSYEEPDVPGGPPSVPSVPGAVPVDPSVPGADSAFAAPPPPGSSPPGTPAGGIGQPWPVPPPPQAQKKRKKRLVILIILVGITLLGAAMMGFYAFSQSQVTNSVPPLAEVGDCYAADESMEPVPCEGPHVYEVFSAVVYDYDTEYPGRLSRSLGNAVCTEDLERFTGVGYITGAWDYAEVYPSEDDWNAGNRVVVCALFKDFGIEVVGSARNQD